MCNNCNNCRDKCERRCREEEIRKLERIICDIEKLLNAAKQSLCDLKSC